MAMDSLLGKVVHIQLKSGVTHEGICKGINQESRSVTLELARSSNDADGSAQMLTIFGKDVLDISFPEMATAVSTKYDPSSEFFDHLETGQSRELYRASDTDTFGAEAVEKFKQQFMDNSYSNSRSRGRGGRSGRTYHDRPGSFGGWLQSPNVHLPEQPGEEGGRGGGRRGRGRGRRGGGRGGDYNEEYRGRGRGDFGSGEHRGRGRGRGRSYFRAHDGGVSDQIDGQDTRRTEDHWGATARDADGDHEGGRRGRGRWRGGGRGRSYDGSSGGRTFDGGDGAGRSYEGRGRGFGRRGRGYDGGGGGFEGRSGGSSYEGRGEGRGYGRGRYRKRDGDGVSGSESARPVESAGLSSSASVGGGEGMPVESRVW